MKKTSGSLPYQKYTQLQNQKKIMKELWFAHRLSRSQLASMCGLTKSAVTYLVSDMIEKGMVVPVPESYKKGIGHPQELLELNSMYGYIIGARVSSTNFRLAISDFCTHILWQECISITDCKSTEDILDLICDETQLAIKQLGISSESILGFGFSNASLIAEHSNLPISPSMAISEFPVEKYLTDRLHVKVLVNQGTANAARILKWNDRANIHKNMINIEINRFIGIGSLINGSVYTNQMENSGLMLSHIVLEPNGTPCICGKKGCWIAMGSLSVLGGDMTIEEAVERAERGEKEYLDKLTQIGVYSGKGISLIIRVMSPDSIMLSGPVIHAEKFIAEPMFRTIEEDVPPYIFSRDSIFFAKDDISAPLMGALLSIVELIID
ncbi:MAG: ROK family transcriptional regulator [Lachnospiraceae bacterium]|nr:ROK family transcriptional regulator [Lachnospiraceae bacterium]